MGYQVLARKWRPQNFAQLVGQEHVVAAISNALENNRLHHAYLFTGTRGVGKTTIARIFSKSLNCESGMSAEPCGQCATCQDIDQGRYIDLLEIDAASRTKVEDTRDLLDNVQYKPTRGEYKVYLIDEVHMLSKHSFNALLKTLEEPPPHVKFLLATTDPQKLPVTILSRCLQFNLKAMSREQISGQLQHILQQEQLHFEAPAIAQLARAANGSMRDALSLTDQAIAQGNGQVTLDVVTAMLGLMDKNQVLKLLNAVLEGNSVEALSQLDALATQAVDYSQLLAEILSLLHQIALTQIVPDACKLETISAKAIYHLATKVPPEQIQLQYQIVLQGRKDLSHAMDGRSGTEMTLLRMLAFNPQRTLVPPSDIANAVLQQPAALKTSDHSAISQPTPQPSEVINGDSYQQDSVDNDDFNHQLAQELALQQQQIMQQAEEMQSAPVIDGYNSLDSSVEVESEVDSTDGTSVKAEVNQAELEQAAEHEVELQANVSPLQQTEALLAMRRGLRQSKEDSAAVKKSDSNTSSADLSRISAPVLEDAGESPLLAANGFREPQAAVTEGQDLFSRHAELDANNPVVADTESLQADIQQARAVPDNSEINPPWDLDEDSIEAADSEAMAEMPSLFDSLEPVQVPQHIQTTSAQNPAESATDVEDDDFDDYADLIAANGVEQVEVNIEIPAFINDSEKVTQAQQLDSWSRDVELSGVGGLTKQLALHSSMQRHHHQCKLTLLASQQHLNNEVAVPQLQQALSTLWQQPVELVIELGQPQNTPFAIQQSINAMRQQYAIEVINKDDNIKLLQQQFEAQVIEGSIKAN